jgi:hypothetical protein
VRILRFQIRSPQGQIDLVNVEAERATLGSGAHCEIRLPIDQARTEHVRIDLGPAGAFATALAFDPPPTLNGVPFTQTPLPPDGILGVGYTQIQVQAVEVGGAAAGQAAEKKASPITLIAGVVVIGVASFFLFTGDEEESPALSSPKQEPLWSDNPKACPQVGGQATALAWEKTLQANAKRERRPFHIQDGVGAVPLFELAEACFRAGGDIANANAAKATSAYLRADIGREYKKYHVALEYHVRIEDWTAARADVLKLLAYTEGTDSKYRAWLVQAERTLRQRAARDPNAPAPPPT